MKKTKNETEVFKEKKTKISFHPDWVSIIIKLLILVGFIFLIIFVITNIRKSNENKTFNKNIEKMRASAYAYFKDENNRPLEENEEIDISLDDMIVAEMIDELRLNKNIICDKDASYIAVTKVTDTKYNLNVNLTCGNKSKTENYTLNYSSLKTNASSNNTSDDSKEPEKISETVIAKNDEKTLYEFSRTIQADAKYTCPSGFTLVGTKCYSNVEVLKANAVPIYNIKPGKNIKASYHREEVSYEYADPIVKSGSTTLTCPTGYNLVNNTCQKITDPFPKDKITYTCPTGYTLNGTKCTTMTSLIKKNATYKCSKGTLTNDNRCKIVTNAALSCKTGKYSSAKKMCYVEINATPNYNSWKYQGVIESKKEKTSTNTILYVYLGKTNKGKNRYNKYTRTVKSYSCEYGTYIGNGKCRYYNESYSKYVCTSGTLNGKKCISYTNAKMISSTSSSCPSGYVKSNDKCIKTINATKNVSKSYYCKAGSTVTSDKKCMVTTTPTSKKGKDTYSCPSGYEQLGSGSSTKCRKKNVTAGYYYCHDDDAVLDNDRCVTASVTTFKGYKCPSGYELAGNYCYKYTSTETIKANKIAGNVINEEYIWSASKRLDGWTFTGNTKKV